MAREFAALEESAPLRNWIRFLGNNDVPSERKQRIAELVEQRQGELAKLIWSVDIGRTGAWLAGRGAIGKAIARGARGDPGGGPLVGG